MNLHETGNYISNSIELSCSFKLNRTHKKKFES